MAEASGRDERTSSVPRGATGPSGAGAGQGFSDRVVVLFATQTITAGLGIFNGFVLARLLGPSAKGDYYLLTLLPTTLMVLIQLGLPQAFSYFSARGATDGLTRRTLALAAGLALPAMAVTVIALPILASGGFAGLDWRQVAFVMLSLPLALNATFTTGVILGRQAVRYYSRVSVGQVASYTLLMLVIVGAFGSGLNGALLVLVLVALIQSTALLVGSARATAAASGASVGVRELFAYGLPLYPASLTQFFSNRADVFVLAALLPDPSAPLGYYSMGVSMAEMVFFFPNAVSTLFFPHVAGADRADADRQVTVVSRVTLLLTGAVAIALVPVATVLISVILPAFTPALPALYVLLPGVVALSITKVLSGYLSGLGRTGVTSAVSICAFVLNVALNLVLIPRAGIVGAAAASLISYTASSLAYSVIAARLAGTSVLDFWVPRWSDVTLTVDTIASLARRVLGALARRV